MKIKMLLCIAVCLALLAGCNSGKAGDMKLSQPDTATALEITTPASRPLQPGYWVLESNKEEVQALRLYLLLKEDGTGEIGILGQTQPLTWNDQQVITEGMAWQYTLEDGHLILRYFVPEDAETMGFRYAGEELPEEYRVQIPVGFFVVSSVGRNGDLSMYGTLDPENGYIRIREDNTGEMFFDGQLRAFVIENGVLNFGEEQAVFQYMPAEVLGDGEDLLMVAFYGDSATSIAFRPAEDPEKP